jgi:CRISPR/Cas system-associated exonuclease Cas4 (RecB family)
MDALFRGYNLPVARGSYIPCVSEIVEYLQCRKCAFLKHSRKGREELNTCASRGILRHRALAFSVNQGKLENDTLSRFVNECPNLPAAVRENLNAECAAAIRQVSQIQNLISKKSKSEVYLTARRIGIRGGKIDILEPDLTPVELKTGRYRSHLHRIQATLYVFLLEFNEKRDIDEAAVIYSHYGIRDQFTVSQKLREETARGISGAVWFYSNSFSPQDFEGCWRCN